MNLETEVKVISTYVVLDNKIAEFEREVEIEELPNKPLYTAKEVLEILKDIKEGKQCK